MSAEAGGGAARAAAGGRPTSSAELRRAFLEFFRERGHEIVPSSPLVPANDPTLLFTNAGMVQFKDVFLGTDKRPYTRATTCQKCMRVSGKHNDLEAVGPSPRHHTFFEMLGNFSFGDYFKREAILWAYELLTRVYGLDPNRLYFTVHYTDDEAFRIWVEEVGVPPERVAKMGDATNFWQMADVGPCGPTTEIHYDFFPERGQLVGEELAYHLDANPEDRFLELWNLVFMQFNQKPDGTREPLPATGVDTGMGLERIASVLQQVPSNYDTDIFVGIMDHVQRLLGHSDEEREQHYVGYRVIADHGRAAGVVQTLDHVAFQFRGMVEFQPREFPVQGIQGHGEFGEGRAAGAHFDLARRVGLQQQQAARLQTRHHLPVQRLAHGRRQVAEDGDDVVPALRFDVELGQIGHPGLDLQATGFGQAPCLGEPDGRTVHARHLVTEPREKDGIATFALGQAQRAAGPEMPGHLPQEIIGLGAVGIFLDTVAFVPVHHGLASDSNGESV